MPTSIEERKEKIIMDLVERRKNILEAASALPAGRREVIFLGSWSITDILTHLIGWDYTNMEAVKNILSDQVPGFFTFYDTDWRTFNSRSVAQRSRLLKKEPSLFCLIVMLSDDMFHRLFRDIFCVLSHIY